MKRFLTILQTVMCSITLMAQASDTIYISGRIVDDQREPIIGANIRIGSTEFGTVTDMEGKFDISMPPNVYDDYLVVSFICYFPDTIIY